MFRMNSTGNNMVDSALDDFARETERKKREARQDVWDEKWQDCLDMKEAQQESMEENK